MPGTCPQGQPELPGPAPHDRGPPAAMNTASLYSTPACQWDTCLGFLPTTSMSVKEQRGRSTGRSNCPHPFLTHEKNWVTTSFTLYVTVKKCQKTYFAYKLLPWGNIYWNLVLSISTMEKIKSRWHHDERNKHFTLKSFSLQVFHTENSNHL